MSSIDAKEVKKFDDLSGKWWDKNGEFSMLHKINPLRISYIVDMLNKYMRSIAECKILDIGCGGGLVSSELCRLGANVTGIDASSNNIIAAKEYAAQGNLDIAYINGAAEDLVGREDFDVVLCLEVIEHVADPVYLIQSISKLVKKDGIVILSTLNRNLKSYFMSIIMAEHVLGLVPKHTHDYSKYIKPSELAEICERYDLKLQDLRGLIPSLCGVWSLSNDISVNYLATFRSNHES